MKASTAIAAALAWSGIAHAGVVYSPGAGEYGSVLFEDQWPQAGDFDFNDVVIRYNYEITTDGAGDATALVLSFNVQALGAASVCSGLGLRLPVAAGTVGTVDRYVGTAGTGAPWTASGTVDKTVTSGQAVLWLVDDLRATACSGDPGFLSTVTGGSVADCRPIAVTVPLAAPVTLPGTEPWDLFVHHCGDRTVQTHRPAYPGTTEANPLLYGDGDDASTGSTWYVTAAGVPFGLHIGEGAPPSALDDDSRWPRERARVDAAWPSILAFAAGDGHTDFYADAAVVGGLLYQGALPPLFAYASTTPVAADVCPGHAVAASRACAYPYSGADVPFVVPDGVTALTVAAWGAGGCGGAEYTGGGGGFVRDTVPVTPGATLYVRVGGGGGNTGDTHAFGGGGAGGRVTEPTISFLDSSGGGGGTFLLAAQTLASEADMLVAAGGGGGGGAHGGAPVGLGGAGGGLAGLPGQSGSATCIPGGGGTQGAGGTGGGNFAANAGDLGVGGDGVTGLYHGGSYYSGGGGGGFYGGGAGDCHSGGGGGSSKDPVAGATEAGSGTSPGGLLDADYPGAGVGVGATPDGVGQGTPPAGIGGHGYLLLRWD